MKTLLKDLESEAKELSILFTDDTEICNLNNDFRGKNKATDVLSFPLEKNDYLGDIAISVQTARKQAKAYGTSLRSEILRLLIHGILHLEGYEHENVSRATARKMQLKEKYLYGVISKKWPNRF